MNNFILIGAAGYIAPRHMQAIKETGNNLIAAFDPHDSVGVLDSYFPDCDFFTEFERFDRHCDKIKRQGTSIDYVVVCSPNYLHDAHIRFGLRIGADVICEKPVVLNPWNVDALLEMEKETGKRVYVVHQLRYHPAIIALKEKVQASAAGDFFHINLQYITPRGNWYKYSWKGDESKSGGILANIGLHFFDVLLWIFGETKKSEIIELNTETASGKLFFKNAEANWLLSISNQSGAQSPNNVLTHRYMEVNNEVVNFTNGFEQLHTTAYQNLLDNNGTTLLESKTVIELIHGLNNA